MGAIKKEERIGGQRLILGDCLEVMKELGRFDACVSDPPYGIQNMVGGYGRGGRTIHNDKDTVAYSEMLVLAYALTDVCLSFYSARNTPDIMNAIPSGWYVGEIIWDKKAPGMGRGIRYQHENIAVMLKNDAKLVGDSFSVLSFYRNADLHPHQKPIELMMKLLSMVGGNVLDPFMGSGSTIVACEKMGYAGTGIELDPQHFETACRRVEEASRQTDMFIQPETKPKQEALF